MTTPNEPLKVPEDVAFVLSVSTFVVRYLADEVASGSTNFRGKDPEKLIVSLSHVAACRLREMARPELLETQRRALAIIGFELLENPDHDNEH